MKLTRTSLIALAIALCMSGPALAGGAALRAAEKVLKGALKSGNEDKIGAALQDVARVGGKSAMRSILKMTDKVRKTQSGKLYWQVISGAAGFRDEEGLAELGDYIVKKKKTGLAQDLLFALQNNVSDNVLKVHEKVLEKGSYAMQLSSVDQLADIHSVASGDLLIKTLESEKGGGLLAERIINALAAMTGESAGDATNWIGWWKANRGKDPFSKRDTTGDSGGGVGSVVRGGARGGESATLERLKKGRVLVIEGGSCCKRFNHNYDDLAAVCERLGVKAERIQKKDFAKLTTADLRKVMAILINCTQMKEHCICPKCKPTGATNMRMQTCGGCSVHDIVKDVMPRAGIDLIRQFVESGGYLFTEDWGLVEVLDKAWPKIIKAGTYLREAGKGPPKGQKPAAGERSQTELPKGGQVDVTPAPGRTGHPYMRGVFSKPKAEKVSAPIGEGAEGTVERGGGKVGSEFRAPKQRWTIDDDSPSIRVVDKRRVKVLLESDELRKITAQLSDGPDAAVAFSFHIGKATKADKRVASGGSRGSKKRGMTSEERLPGGRVLHVLSHFGKQASETDERAMYNLLYNFLLECARRRGMSMK